MGEIQTILFCAAMMLFSVFFGTWFLNELMYFKNVPTKTQRHIRITAIICYAIYTAFAVFSFFYFSINRDEMSFDENIFHALTLLVQIPMFIGGLLMVPYRFVFVPIYLISSKKLYPQVTGHLYFPNYLIPGRMEGGAVRFLFVRGYRVSGVSRFFVVDF